MNGHVVIAGCGKLTMLYLERLRTRRPQVPVVVVENRGSGVNRDEARDLHGANLVLGDITSDALLASLRLEVAERVVLLTGDDFANLDAATKIIAQAPQLAGRVVVHVSNLHFLRGIDGTSVEQSAEIFNTHQIAAEHLVHSKLVPHFEDTPEVDTVVLAGFGRFGQSLLAELQRSAGDTFDTLVVIDLDCAERANVFDEQVGFAGDYRRELVDGDLRDPTLWHRVVMDLELGDRRPAFVLGSGDDGVNLQTALWLTRKYPEAFIVARSFRSSSFATEVAGESGFEAFSVAELVKRSMPGGWLDGP
jgi:Trk K+ transport system NAD-binding subunit